MTLVYYVEETNACTYLSCSTVTFPGGLGAWVRVGIAVTFPGGLGAWVRVGTAVATLRLYCMKPSKNKVLQCALYSILCTVCYIFPLILIKFKCPSIMLQNSNAHVSCYKTQMPMQVSCYKTILKQTIQAKQKYTHKIATSAKC